MAKAKKAPTFDDTIAAAIELVSEFRDELHAETSRMVQERGDNPESFDPAKHSHLHRIRIASDNFLSALSGVW